MVRLVNRAKMTTATTGTGTITLGAASDGFQTFAGAGVVDGDLVRYVIEEGTAFELGSGVFSSAGGTLTRNPSESSAGGGAITLTGNALVFVGAASADVQSDVTITGGTIDGTVIGGSTPAAISGTTGSFSGTLQADNITDEDGTGAPNFPNGIANGVLRKGEPIIFTSSGTYTPSAGTRAIFVEVQGAGGAGGQAAATGAAQCAYAGGGAGGAFSSRFIVSPAVGTVTIGAGGVAGATPTGGGNSVYADGTFTLTAPGGGAGGNRSAVAEGGGSGVSGSAGAAATGGTLNLFGQSSGVGANTGVDARGFSGFGGGSLFGAGGRGQVNGSNASSQSGFEGKGFGAGGAGGGNSLSQTATNGGDGSPGLIIIQEFE